MRPQASAAMPYTSADRPHAKPLSVAVGPWLQAPISSLAVPFSATASDSFTDVTCGVADSASSTCPAMACQIFALSPVHHDRPILPGSPATMCGSTLPAPPAGAMVIGDDHFDRSGGACTTLMAAPL